MKKLFLVLAAAILGLNTLYSQQHIYYDDLSGERKIQTVLSLISSQYVDTFNQGRLIEEAIRKMLKELDPHSVYMTKQELQEANEPLLGNFEGVGIQFNILNDTILVVATIPGGPSEKLGILAGDKIIKINNEEAFGKKINNNFVMKRLRGEKGTKVTVAIYRKGKKELIDYIITRDKIPLTSIDATYMAAPEVGYIKLNRFSKTSISEFYEAMGKLKQEGMKYLILDLRDNTGGFLDVAVDLSDEFLNAGKLIVYTEGLRSFRFDYKSTEKGSFEQGRLAILINENSASASEIVSGAIQDWDRGIIIGRRSFGKGLVQKPFGLPDGSAIRLTTARYYTPTGRCIQKSYKEGADNYYKDLQNRYKHKEYVNPDSIKFPDSLKYYTKNKRVVYGGGGIMPDIFIPLDTSFYSDYYSNILRKGTIYQFTLQFVNDNRAMLKDKYKTIKNFNKDFSIDDAFLKIFTDYSEAQGVKLDEKGLQNSKEYIILNLKALIARNIWNIDAFFEVFNTKDVTMKKAIELLKGNDLKKYKISY
ncbi:MAG: S41 family peptidase [Bacteroidales bacterium]|nr:S41 family peptidase [Bacteroidales bacterium]